MKRLPQRPIGRDFISRRDECLRQQNSVWSRAWDDGDQLLRILDRLRRFLEPQLELRASPQCGRIPGIKGDYGIQATLGLCYLAQAR